MKISLIHFNNYDAIWATPLSGYAHIADEQPLPYIHISGKEITPRFGGENVFLEHLPLPYGEIASNWPLKQRIFNFFRKRINIYWRELFSSFTRKDNLFFFYQQCKFTSTLNSFKGLSPVVIFKRRFHFSSNGIAVNDEILFLEKIKFSKFIYCNFCENIPSTITITCSEETNFELTFRSSTGPAKIKGKRLKDVSFSPGDILQCQFHYHLPE